MLSGLLASISSSKLLTTTPSKQSSQLGVKGTGCFVHFRFSDWEWSDPVNQQEVLGIIKERLGECSSEKWHSHSALYQGVQNLFTVPRPAPAVTLMESTCPAHLMLCVVPPVGFIACPGRIYVWDFSTTMQWERICNAKFTEYFPICPAAVNYPCLRVAVPTLLLHIQAVPSEQQVHGQPGANTV